jgi:hypothetical protein
MKNFEIQWKALEDKKRAEEPEVPKITTYGSVTVGFFFVGLVTAGLFFTFSPTCTYRVQGHPTIRITVPNVTAAASVWRDGDSIGVSRCRGYLKKV